MSAPHLLDLPCIGHGLGDLTFAQAPTLPFAVARSYWITGIPAAAQRGGHVHRATEELLVVLHGSARVRLSLPDRQTLEFHLDRPDRGLYLPPHWWREIDDYAENSVCLVLASLPYNEDDYIRQPADFFRQ